eukprot:CAMPEP_0183338296 /NCGR_PEP_ID=MMETSP0164_2-20130417/5642_1 /TAXON_ID=221442 /ORGANISM="Coccolithus pelagicus ssp braarudi, Strain PLY182g" /LENGTH=240 /DNA_ID=CAMNT_0025508127 /DNA_START=40 /DNA_END=762 /DNA_ORIENTATION=+
MKSAVSLLLLSTPATSLSSRVVLVPAVRAARAPANVGLCARVADAVEDVLEMYPSESMSPVRATEIQCLALQQGNGRVFWRFVSPEAKRATGILRRPQTEGIGPCHSPWLAPPDYGAQPLYMPLLGSRKFTVVGALAIGTELFQCRVRVWPAGGERECAGGVVTAPPVEYIWQLALQPTVRPACYEDDPLQQGVSSGPPFGGCWLVDDVRLDDRWHGGEGDDNPMPTGGGPAVEVACLHR